MKVFGLATMLLVVSFIVATAAPPERVVPISFHIGQDDSSIVVFGGGGAVKGRKLNQLVELLNTAVDVINSEDGVNGIKVPSAAKEKRQAIIKVTGLVRQSPGRYLLMMKTESNPDASIEITRDAMSDLEKMICRKIDDENGITEALEYDGPIYPVTRNIDVDLSNLRDTKGSTFKEFQGRNPNRRGTAPICGKE